ncbi:MAG TPA: lactonase family protein [Pilimelia sp.]|nr:lactonase family protein [Pilimelia sp.]
MAGGEVIYIGGYTVGCGGEGEGITAARRDPATGALRLLGVVARADAPSFLAHHPRLPVLYAVSEVADGAVSAWAVEPEGALRPLGSRQTGGAHPCHVAVTADGSHVLVANYGSGSVAVLPLDAAGAVGERTDLVEHREHGPDPERQERAHAHMVSVDPDGRRVRAVDLGADTIYRYVLDDGRLRPAEPTLRTRPGTGPRHLARGPGGWLYVAGELDATVTAYGPDPDGGPPVEAARVASTDREGQTFPSEIAVDAAGRYLYVANRGPDTIAVFALADGLPRYISEVATGGRWPRHFALWEDFLYVANERSHAVVIFRIIRSTGVPVATGEILDVPTPTCVLPPIGR